MPTNRGYDSFFGYLSGMQDHFTEQLGSFIACKTVVDLTEQDRPAPGDQNGTYSGWLYNRRAVQVIDDAAAQRRRWLAARAGAGAGAGDAGATAATAATAPLAPPKPFFLNYWMQNTHGPVEVPEQYSSLYNFSKAEGAPKLNTFYGMVSVVDEAVGNITAALKEGGLWESTLVVYTHDNGAPLGAGGSNFPLRGGKNSNFEG